MTQSNLVFNLLFRGTRAGIASGLLAGVLLSIPMAMLSIVEALWAGFIIGGIVGFINSVGLAAVHIKFCYPAGIIPDTTQYQRLLSVWMAIQTAILTYIGAHLMYPDLEPGFYAYWSSPILGFLFAIVVTHRITGWYLSSTRKKKHA
ncbi:MAG: hypothetical protein ACPG7F_04415 [Aggregatilineales bacterium]